MRNLLLLGKTEITVEVDYNTPYRFRLWRALVEDKARMGSGYRAYYSHMYSCFDAWHRQGIKFLTAQGRLLNLAALKPDDLYGFLDAGGISQSGPGRRLSRPKMAVIDAFLRAKFPQLSFTLSSDDSLRALAAANRAFFSNSSTLPVPATTANMEGAYFLYPIPLLRHLLSRARENTEANTYIDSYFIRYANPEYYIVHYTRVPALPKYISALNGRENVSNSYASFFGRTAKGIREEAALLSRRLDRNRSFPIFYSGIGYPISTSDQGFSDSIFLRP